MIDLLKVLGYLFLMVVLVMANIDLWNAAVYDWRDISLVLLDFLFVSATYRALKEENKI